MLLKSRSGNMFIFVLIILTFLITFTAVVGELYRVHSIQGHVEYELQRAVNIAVEDAMHDSWRQDKFGNLDTERAEQNVSDYLNVWMGLTPAMEKFTDGKLIYSIQLDSVTATETPPRAYIKGKVVIPSAYPFLAEAVEAPFDIASRNVRVD